MPVKTAKVSKRRKVEYATLADVLNDAGSLHTGKILLLGNWSEGQIFKHLALAYNGSIDGFANKFSWPMRLMGRAFKRKLVASEMPAGFRGPSEIMPPPVPAEEGLSALHHAVDRLLKESTRAHHPMLGELTIDQWNQVHLAHARLHMSFLAPG